MKIISANLNGIRSAERKGFFEWLKKQRADFVCVQETKAQMAVLEGEVYRPENYFCHFSDAVKKGYSGVGIYSREKPDNIVDHLGFPLSDTEGRYMQFDVGDLTVASIYFPSGSSGDVRQEQKMIFLDKINRSMQKLMKSGRKVVLCGDYNIVHKEIDIKNWKSNQKNSGCLPEERAWLDKIFDKQGWVDAFRVVNQQPDQYTWWSNRGQAYANNVGWRIDYQVVTPNLRDSIKKVSIYKEQKFSDHAPLIITYD